ncbi:MAG: HAMP domain-containing protein, partial [Candidatus Sericytochromatia bacterium]
MGLRLRIMLVFLLMAGLAAGIVLAGVLFPLIGQYEKANAELASDGRQSAALAADFLADRRSDTEKLVTALATYDELVYRNYEAASAHMRTLVEASGPKRWIVALDRQGRVVASNEPIGQARFDGLPIVEAARSHNDPVWSDRLAWPANGEPAVAVALRYRYYDRRGAHWGVIVTGCDLGAWNEALNRQGKVVEVFDRRGQRLVPTTESRVAGPRLEVAEALAGRQGSRMVDQALQAYAPVPVAGWAVVATAPAAETLLPIHQNIETATRWGALALLVTGVLSFFLSGFLVAPIRRLEAAAGALTRGEWEAAEAAKDRLPSGQDELGRLASSFVTMAAQLKDRFAGIEAEVADRTRELERTNNQLTYAIQELKELDEMKRSFLDAVSHELRTPLNFIMGYGSGLEDGL